MKSSIVLVLVSILAVTFVATTTPAQAPPANDVNAALVRELRDLRIAIEKLVSTGSRLQVLSTRTNQQEQRISLLMGQLVGVNGKLSEASAQTLQKTSVLEQIRESLRQASDPAERDALRSQEKDVAAQLNSDRLMQAATQAQADAIRQQLSLEQATLTDLQHRLDELERSMEPRQ
jgi:hypothetical protein